MKNKVDPGVTRIISKTVDPELQAIVDKAAKELKYPIALVSLVLENIQYFTAHVGLPDELAATRATDRQASFCQFVVDRGAPFLIEDAAKNQKLPQDLVDAYGIRSYAGFPVMLNNNVVGSLCVIDLKPRRASIHEQNMMSQLAHLVSKRMQQLHDKKDRTLKNTSKSSAADFEDIKRLLAAWKLQEDYQSILMAELAPLGQIINLAEAGNVLSPRARKALSVLKQAWNAHGQILDSSKERSKLLIQLLNSIKALESKMK